MSNMEKAIYVIDLKIAKIIKNSDSLKYSELRELVRNLKKEKMEIYNKNEEVINKVLTVYLNDITK